MSAPKTNLEKQRRRHVGPLVGIALVVLFGAVMSLFIFDTALDNEPTDTDQAAPAIEAPATATSGD